MQEPPQVQLKLSREAHRTLESSGVKQREKEKKKEFPPNQESPASLGGKTEILCHAALASGSVPFLTKSRLDWAAAAG